MIKSISFKNYKIFKEKQLLEIKPITVVFGKNNSGKSAVAKLPTLIEGALKRYSEAEINVVNDNVELGAELRDLVYGRANRDLEFEIESANDSLSETGIQTKKLSISVNIDNTSYRQVPKIVSWALDDVLKLQYEEDNTYRNDKDDEDYFALFQGFYLTQLMKTEKPDSTESIPVMSYDFQTDFIGSIRQKPSRDYRLSPSRPEKSGIYGENTYQFLIEDALTTEKKLLTEVSKWYKKNFEGWELTVNQDKAPIYQIELRRGDLRQNIIDTGIGMSQVLPIVTRVKQKCYEETLVIVEEPELHLHPAAHGNLAELFVDSISQGKKRYLVETHSLNFILRLRRMVAEKKIDKELIALYYVDFIEEENVSTLTKIDIDILGRVSYWPSNIFDETLTETIGIRTAQLKTQDKNED